MPATIIDALVVTLGLDAAEFKQGQHDAQKSLKDTEQQADTTAKTLQSKGNQGAEFFGRLAVGAAGLVVAYEGVRKTMADLYKTAAGGAAAGRQAFQLNMSVTDLMAWENAMESIGGSAEGASSAIQQLVHDQQAMRTGTPPRSMQVAAQFGVNPNGNITQIAEGFEKSPAFNRLTPAMKEYWLSQVISDPTMRYAIEHGQVESLLNTQAVKGNLTSAQSQTEQKYQTAVENLSQSWSLLNTDMTTEFLPTLTAFVNGVTSLITWVTTHLGDPAVVAQQASDALGMANTESKKQVLSEGLQFYMGKGLTYDQAAGIMGNVQDESGFDPNAQQKDKDGNVRHMGLLQWSEARRQLILKNTGIDVWHATPQQQYEASWWELTHTENATLKKLQANPDGMGAPGENAVIFRNNDLRPGWNPADSALRALYAQHIAAASQTTSIENHITVHAPSGNPNAIASSIVNKLAQHQGMAAKAGNAVN